MPPASREGGTAGQGPLAAALEAGMQARGLQGTSARSSAPWALPGVGRTCPSWLDAAYESVVRSGCPAYSARGPVSWLLMRPRSAQWIPGVTPLESRVLELEPGLLPPGFPHGCVSCPLQNRSLGNVSKSLWGWTQRQPR